MTLNFELTFTRSALLATAGAVGLLALSAAPAAAVPSYARQTGLACEACHTVFPELTPFGRRFKLDGYQINNRQTISDVGQNNRTNLQLSFFSPISAMVVAGYTNTNKPAPDSNGLGNAQNNTVEFPSQLSLFYAGQIAPHLGTFIQITYDPTAGSVGMDNTDIRFADTEMLSSGSKVDWGISLNNNPTVQDLWDTVPAWYNPYMTPNTVAGQGAGGSAFIDGAVGGNAAGLSVYGMLNNTWYAEAGVYTSAPQGVNGPYDSTAGMVIDGGAPYWRFAGEWDWDNSSFEIGTYGMSAHTRVANDAAGDGCLTQTSLVDSSGNPIFDTSGACQGVGSGPTDDYLDYAFDTQYQYIGDRDVVTLAATWIHEDSKLNSTASAYNLANGTNLIAVDTHMDTMRGSVSYYYHRMIGGSIQPFNTTGSSTDLMAKPDTNGVTFEVDYLPFLNTKLALAYTTYGKFAGTSAGASDNNTLYGYLWIAF